MNVVDIGIDTAKRHRATKINSIVVEVGSLSGVIAESLYFCFESVCKGTIADGANLSLIQIPGQAKCENCQNTFETDLFVAQCPDCGEMVFDVQGGRELRVKTINID